MSALCRFKLGTLKMNDVYFWEMPNVCLFGKLPHLPSRKGMELGKEGSSGSSRSPPTKKTGVARGPTDHSATGILGDHSRIWVEKTCVPKFRNLQKAELIQSPRRSQEGVRLLKIWVIHPLVFGGFFAERCLQNLPKPAGTPQHFDGVAIISRWWFQICFIFTPIWGRFPFWLIFFRWVETTN